MEIFRQFDEAAMRRRLLTLFGIAVVVFSAGFGMSRNMPIIGLLIPALVLVFGMINRPVVIFILVQFVSLCELTAPRLPSSFPVSNIVSMLMIGWAVLDMALKKRHRPFSYQPKVDGWMWFFALNLLLIITVRGSGLASMGGTVYGGAAYISLWVSIIYYLSLVRIQLNEKDIKWLIYSGLAAACIPMAVEVLLYFREGAAIGLTKYIDVSATYALMEKYTVGGVVRWGSFWILGSGLITAGFVLCKNKLFRLVLIGAGLLLTAMSGFRNILASSVVLVAFLSLYYSKSRFRTFLLLAFLGLAGYGILMISAPMLPRGVQRAVSIVPGITVDQTVAFQAKGSTSWRVEMWRDYCIPAIPEYLLVGKGMAREITEYAWLSRQWYGTAEFFYFIGAYHSGPFNLLLNYGLPGTVSFIAFFFLTIIDGWRTMRRYASHQDSLLARYYIFLTIQLTWSIISFFLIFGDVSAMLLSLLVIAAQMRILKKKFMTVEPGSERLQGEG